MIKQQNYSRKFQFKLLNQSYILLFQIQYSIGMLSQERIKKIRESLKIPQFYKVVKVLNEKFEIIVFPEPFPILGKGSFGKCYLGKIRLNQSQKIDCDCLDDLIRHDKLIAIKVIEKVSKATSISQLYKNQIKILSSLHNNSSTLSKPVNIIKVYPHQLQTEHNFYVLMEYCNNCTLGDFMNSRKVEKRQTTLWQFLQIMQDIISGYSVLKQHNILHNDLKPQNIFIKDKIFKIGDFGLSAKLKTTNLVSLGTILYAAPQKLVLNPQIIDYKADIYSIGIILATILYGTHPYFNQEEYDSYSKAEISKSYKLNGLKGVSQKALRKRIFLSYIEYKAHKFTPSGTTLTFKKEYSQLVDQIEKLVLSMIQVDKPKRISLSHIAKRMKDFKLDSLYSRQDLFSDLKSLSQTNFRIQVNNMTKMMHSVGQVEAQFNQYKQESLIETTLLSVWRIKNRLSSIFRLYDVLSTLSSELRISLQDEGVFKQFTKYYLSYLYYINLRELKVLQEDIRLMSQQQIKIAKRENIQSDMKRLEQNSLQLFESQQTLQDPHSEIHRANFMDFIKKTIKGDLVSSHTWFLIVIWLLIYTAVEIECKFVHEDSIDFLTQLEKLESMFLIFKIEPGLLKQEEYEKALEFIKKHEMTFELSYEISTE